MSHSLQLGLATGPLCLEQHHGSTAEKHASRPAGPFFQPMQLPPAAVQSHSADADARSDQALVPVG